MIFQKLKTYIFHEMAAAYTQSQFQPGIKIFIKGTNPLKPDFNQSSHIKVIVGKLKLSNRVDAYVYDPQSGNKRVTRFFPDDPMSEDEIIKALKDDGYRLAKVGAKPTGETENYANGKHQSGTFGLFSGTLYHGSHDIGFPFTTKNKEGFGKGSHLKSLNDHDALSLTTSIETAEGFASQQGSIMIYRVSNLKIYYASRDEDDLDEIDYKYAHAVAIPQGRYKEDEFAVVRKDNPLHLTHIVLPYPMKGKLGRKRYAYTENYIEEWLKDVLGQEFIDLVNEYGVGNKVSYSKKYSTDILEYHKIKIWVSSSAPYFNFSVPKGNKVLDGERTFHSVKEFKDRLEYDKRVREKSQKDKLDLEKRTDSDGHIKMNDEEIKHFVKYIEEEFGDEIMRIIYRTSRSRSAYYQDDLKHIWFYGFRFTYNPSNGKMTFSPSGSKESFASVKEFEDAQR